MAAPFDLSTIPTNPGVYFYKDSKGIIIYIGKAKSLRKRVSSYFNRDHADAKTAELVKRIVNVDTLVTNTEVEALVLENNLIKKHQPKYNINLKDSKRYAYLQLTEEEYPRLLLARKNTGKGKFFGPFISASSREYIRKTVTKAFKIRTCKKLPKKECLRYHINLCPAPCVFAEAKKTYLENIKRAELVLKGKTDEVISDLKKEMKEASTNQLYEHALQCREQLTAIEWLNERQTMERKKEFDEDIIHFMVKDDVVYLLLFNIHKGMLDTKQEFSFDATEEFFEEFLLQYYADAPIPKEIILPKKIDPELHAFLEERRGKKVTITVPKIGEKKDLLYLVKKNIEISFFSDYEKMEALRKALRLPQVPEVIECFDISHLQGTHTVASMVQFRRSKPDKSNYRRFKIKTVSGIDDFSSMNEVVTRRYRRLKEEHGDFPDLIVIDGGKGQLHASLDALRSLGVSIPMISLAKKFEEIYLPGLSRPIRLDKKNKGLQLLQAVRDEAHRFAITYNRLLRKKAVVEED